MYIYTVTQSNGLSVAIVPLSTLPTKWNITIPNDNTSTLTLFLQEGVWVGVCDGETGGWHKGSGGSNKCPATREVFRCVSVPAGEWPAQGEGGAVVKRLYVEKYIYVCVCVCVCVCATLSGFLYSFRVPAVMESHVILIFPGLGSHGISKSQKKSWNLEKWKKVMDMWLSDLRKEETLLQYLPMDNLQLGNGTNNRGI